MKIAILRPSYEGSAEPIRDLDPVCDPSIYLPDHECHSFAIAKQHAVQQLIEIQRLGFDVVINLCDGAWHGDTAGIEVVQTLEKLNMAFTGSGSALYDPSREAMKMACHSAGIRFPAYVMARSSADIAKALQRLRFPMLVKHPQGYSSVGLTRASRVTNEEDLRTQVEIGLREYGAALIEEFIEGPEYTVLVTEPRQAGEEAWALDPIAFTFPPGESFKHFDLKWIHYDDMGSQPVQDPELAARLKQMAASCFKALGCTGYARCDIRADRETGELYLLEINPNCAVFYPPGQFGSADLILAADPAGHRGFLDHQIQCALRRHARNERPWQLEYSREGGFGMFATRAIEPGELVEPYEERPAVLVSRRHAERHWSGHRRRWFDQYAWPVSDDIHVMWSDDPAAWRPINHSCDPNTWLTGLDVVARREIAPGEELTIDYATFCGPGMEQFECNCGSPDCRRVITGSDYLRTEVRERYHGHVSDYIAGQYRRNPAARNPGFIAKQGTHGIGVVACRPYRRGEVLCPFYWDEILDHPTVHSVQIDEQQHAEPRPFLLRYINHSCDPNVIFDVDAMMVRAVRDIRHGEELTFFYPATEWDMNEPFRCACDAPDCHGWIAGASHMPLDILKRYDLSGIVGARALEFQKLQEAPSSPL